MTLYKGNTSEAVVLTAYVREGFLVCLPFGGGAAYDFCGARLLKVQVKTGKLVGGCVVYNARRHRGSKDDTFRRYKEGEVDYFSVWCPADQVIYAVPAECSFTGEGRLRVAETQNFQRNNIKWARDFGWDAHVELLRAEMLATRQVAQSLADTRPPVISSD